MTAPAADERLGDWAGKLAMSRRTFTRFFQKQTGLSFVAWRQQASLFACLPKLDGSKNLALFGCRHFWHCLRR